MGKLEKVGIVVVGCLILVIVVVGAINQGGENDRGGDTGDRETARSDADQNSRANMNRAGGNLGDDFNTIHDEVKGGEGGEAPPAGKEVEEKPGQGGQAQGKPINIEQEDPPVDPAGEVKPTDEPEAAGEWPKKHTVKKGDYIEKLADTY